MDRGAWRAAVHGVAEESDMTATKQQQHGWLMMCVSFCCTAKWISDMYTHRPIFKRFFSHIDFKYFVIHFKTLQWMEKQVSRPMAPHSSTLAWKIPWTEEPGRLQSMGSLRVGHDWATSLSRFTFMRWRRKWQPTPVFLPGESQGFRSLVGCYGVTQSRTRLKRLSRSSRPVVKCILERAYFYRK